MADPLAAPSKRRARPRARKSTASSSPTASPCQDTVVDIVMVRPSPAPAGANGAARAARGDARIPAKKADASLREFLSARWTSTRPSYAARSSSRPAHSLTARIDPRRRHKLLPHPRRPPAAASPRRPCRSRACDRLPVAAQKFTSPIVAADAYQALGRASAPPTRSGMNLAPGPARPAGRRASGRRPLAARRARAAAAAGAAAAAVEREKGKNAHMGMQRPGFGGARAGHNTSQGADGADDGRIWAWRWESMAST